jgi:hypothetical protein
MLQALHETLTNLRELGPGDEIDDVIFSSFDGLAEQQIDACRALRDAADEAGVEFDSDCPESTTWEICIAVSDAGEADCEPEGNDAETVNVAPGVLGRLADTPPLPAGLTAVSAYIEFEAEAGADGALVIGVPLTEPQTNVERLGWYSYVDGEWVRLDARLTLEQDRTIAQGDFGSVPASLAVLRED